ncbi:MAG: hypothetical protein D9V47_11390 [Clostridia bacterium]|nr:MAG: hypothetical protein D9V47_11390 [Clostridia bacterium]
MWKKLILSSVLMLVVLLVSAEAQAKPDYIDKVPAGYEKSCNLCHSAVPALNEFGRKWVAAGRDFQAMAKPATGGAGVKTNPPTTAPGAPKAAISRPQGLEPASMVVTVGGDRVRLTGYMARGQFLAPARELARVLGLQVEWQHKEKVVVLRHAATTVSFNARSGQVMVNAVEQQAPAARLAGGRSFLPLRFVANALGYGVSYDPQAGIKLVTAAAHRAGQETPLQETPSQVQLNTAHPGTAYIEANGYAGANTCLTCHPQAGEELLDTAHYRLVDYGAATKDFNGGSYDLPAGMANRFCGFPAGAAGISWAYLATSNTTGQADTLNSCGKCHVTLGTTGPPNFMADTPDPAEKEKLDCLICHAEKYPARRVEYVDTPQGKAGVFTLDPEEAYAAALTVGPTNTEICMRCHEHAMQGEKYKRMTPFTPATDVHAAAGMECTDCHTVQNHKIAKGQAATDLVDNDLPEVEVSCAKCHTPAPHQNQTGELLNEHAQVLACESCHVPDTAFSLYDWSKMVLNPETGYYEPTITHEPGKIAWRWFNGTGTAMANALSSKGLVYPGQKGNPPEDKITPFRGFNSIMPVDKKNPFILLPFDLKMLKETGDPDAAVKSAMASPFMQMLYSQEMVPYLTKMAAEFNQRFTPGPWSGEYMWAPMPMDATLMINHAITAGGRSCTGCHSEKGVFDWQGLGYSEEEITKLTSLPLK